MKSWINYLGMTINKIKKESIAMKKITKKNTSILMILNTLMRMAWNFAM